MRDRSEMNTRQQIDTCKITAMFIVIAGMLGTPSIVQAGDYFNGFEVDTDNWFDVTQVPSGTGGVTSASGSYHAITDTGPQSVYEMGGIQ